MASNGSGKSNLASFVWAGVVIFVAFLAAIVGLALAKVDVTSLVIGLGALLAAIVVAIPGTLAYFQAKAAREENIKTNIVLDSVAKQVDGMTTKLVVAEVGKAVAEGETRAAVLAVVTAEELAEATAAPSPNAPIVTTTDGILNVNVVNEKPVEVDVVEKGTKE